MTRIFFDFPHDQCVVSVSGFQQHPQSVLSNSYQPSNVKTKTVLASFMVVAKERLSLSDSWKSIFEKCFCVHQVEINSVWTLRRLYTMKHFSFKTLNWKRFTSVCFYTWFWCALDFNRWIYIMCNRTICKACEFCAVCLRCRSSYTLTPVCTLSLMSIHSIYFWTSSLVCHYGTDLWKVYCVYWVLQCQLLAGKGCQILLNAGVPHSEMDIFSHIGAVPVYDLISSTLDAVSYLYLSQHIFNWTVSLTG